MGIPGVCERIAGGAAFGWVFVAVVCASCSPAEQSLFPMKAGQHWTYQVQGDFDTFVDDVVVTSRTEVGGVRGWELQGRMGTSRLGWDGSTLLASELGGRFFDPPLPLFSRSVKSWKGVLTIGGKRAPCSAILVTSKTVEKVGGRNTEAWQTTLKLSGAAQPVTLESWFVSGIGLLKQEQRTGDRRDRRLEYLSGPVGG